MPTLRCEVMPNRRSKLQNEMYFRVLRILQSNPDITQRELAEQLGVSVGGINYCLKALIDKGWVKMQRFGKSKNKFNHIYLLTPQGLARKAALAGSFLKHKMEEYEMLRAEIESLRLEASATAKSEELGSGKV